MGMDRTLVDSLLDEIGQKCEHKERERKRAAVTDVYLNVYDLVWLNDYTSRIGIGAFHSGVEVHGREYAYGGHPYSFTGVYDMEPRQEDEIAGQGVKFRESLHMGHTSMSETEVKELVHSLGKEYNGNAYHILNKNCNHFSSELCQKLSGTHAPPWINRLAYVSSWMPFLLNCLPPSWLTPGDGATVYSSFSHSQGRAQSSNSENQSTADT